MTLSVKYTDSFRDVLPGMFSQILEGSSKKEYCLNTGHIRIFLARKGSDRFDPYACSSGSLDVAIIATKINNFFHDVDLGQYYNLDSDEITKKVLSGAFRQIICGEREETYRFDDAKEVALTIRRESAYLLDFQGRVIRYEYNASGLGEEEEENLERALCSVVDIPNLIRYYNSPSV